MSWPPNYQMGQPVLLVQAPTDQMKRVPGDKGMSLKKIKQTIAFLKELEEAKETEKKKKGGDKKEDEPKKERINPAQMLMLLVFMGPPIGLAYLYFLITMAHTLVENLHTIFK